MSIFCIGLSILLTLIGITFFRGDVIWYIKEWRNLTKEERELVRLNQVCKEYGIIIISAGIIFLLTGIVPIFKDSFFLISSILWFILTTIEVVRISRYINTKESKVTQKGGKGYEK